MPTSRPLPIRIMLKGASLQHAISELPQQRDQFVFARETEDALLADGYGVEVRNLAIASQPMSHAFRTWEADVKAYAPDVVVVTHGYYECVHLLMPRWLERHANSLKARPGPVRSRYRQWLLRPVWKLLAQFQQKTDRIVGARGFGRQARKFETLLTAYIDRTRTVGRPLVVVLEFLAPGARGKSWFPGMEARVELMNAAMRRVVDSYDSSDVVMLPVPALMAEHIPAGVEANADGFHYTALGHQVVGTALAEVIKGWVAGQPRLQPR